MKPEHASAALRPLAVWAVAPGGTRIFAAGIGARLCEAALNCHKCGGRREVRAFVSSPALARKALEDLGVTFEPLKIAKGHDPPSQESLDFGTGFDGVDGIDPSHPD